VTRRARIAITTVGTLFVGLLQVTTMSQSAAAGRSIVFTYDVRGLDNRSSLTTFAAQAAQTYADQRGWSLGGSVTLRRVNGTGDYTLWLSAASRVPGFGSPCDSAYSCRVGRNVVINEDRWLSATPSWMRANGSVREYRHLVVNHETGHWLGFDHSSCQGPGQLAPVMQQQSISLQGCRPNAWPLTGERQQLAGRLGVAIVSGSPIGALDSVTPGIASVRVSGWVIDPDTRGAARVHVYVDKGGIATTAARARPDLARVYPRYGPAHGFIVVLHAAPGVHRVCAYGLNVVGAGRTTTLGCRTVAVTHSPIGVTEALVGRAHSVRATGWLIDPDTTAAVRVHVYVDRGGVAATANGMRLDVARRYPRYGARHGFNVTTFANPGRHRVCVYGLNRAGPGSTTTFLCRSLVVPA
jgi:hypothetical protein